VLQCSTMKSVVKGEKVSISHFSRQMLPSAGKYIKDFVPTNYHVTLNRKSLSGSLSTLTFYVYIMYIQSPKVNHVVFLLKSREQMRQTDVRMELSCWRKLGGKNHHVLDHLELLKREIIMYKF